MQNRGLPTDYVGHPLIDELPEAITRKQACKRLSLDDESLTIVAMPGSRNNELDRLLKPIVDAL